MHLQRTSRIALLVVAMLAPAVGLHAQAVVRAEPTVWLTYAGEHAITSGGTALVFDTHIRRADAFADWRQLLLRAGLSRGVGSRVRVSGGWAYLRSFPDESRGPAVATWDHRAWQMLQVSHGLRPLSLVHRARLEQRFFRSETTDPSSTADWSFVWRARYQLRATAPITRRVYALASQEVFASFGPHVGSPDMDQSRTSVGLGARITPTLRMEVGYLNRAAIDDGRAHTRDHALQVAIASAAPLHTGRRRPAAP